MERIIDKIKIESFGRRIILNIQITCDADGDDHIGPTLREAINSIDLIPSVNPLHFESEGCKPNETVKISGDVRWYGFKLINGERVSVHGVYDDDDNIELSPNAEHLLCSYARMYDDKTIESYKDDGGNLKFRYK